MTESTEQKTKPKTGWLKKVVIAIAAIFVFLIVIGLIAGPEPDSSPGAAEATASSPEVERVKVTAKELFRAYEANEAAAQQQYGDRPLEVTAIVAGVDLDFGNEPVVKLATDNEFMSAHAQLDEASQAKAAGLKKGQLLTLECDEVSEVIGTPILSGCSF